MVICFSFTLYGDSKKYFDPILENIRVISQNFSNWRICIVYDVSVPFEYILQLEALEVELVCSNDPTTVSVTRKMGRRYYPILNDKYDATIVRDTDSIISDREVELINTWLNSSYDFHIIRDHPLHNMPIMGGLFGIKKSLYGLFRRKYFNHFQNYERLDYNGDQLFLAHCLYLNIIDSALIHTSCYAFYGETFVKISKSSNYKNFIGSVAFSNDTQNTKQYKEAGFQVGPPFIFFKILNFRGISIFSKFFKWING